MQNRIWFITGISGGLGKALAEAVIEQVEVGVKYAGYITKQNEGVDRAVHYEGLRLPSDFDYAGVSALSFEVRQRLNQHRPETLSQAARLPGVTAAAISLLLVHLKKRSLLAAAASTAADPARRDAA